MIPRALRTVLGCQPQESIVILSRTVLLTLCGLGVGTGMSTAQSGTIGGDYQRASGTYLARAGWQGTLDVYYRADVPKALPTVINFHGGPSTMSGKTDVTLELQRYLSWGVNVVNVEWVVPGGTLFPVAIPTPATPKPTTSTCAAGRHSSTTPKPR